MLLEKKREREVQIPTSSMADIAFLLLTFFLVTTSLDLDKGLQLVLPPTGTKIELSRSKIASIFVNANGDVLMDEEEIPIGSIKDKLRIRLNKNKDLIVSIKTDRDTPYQAFMSVLDQVQLADATQISIAEPEM
ncbi:biopolymer transporter ExbD [bacterium]|nr:biopolymer transporter ExbD [bacterium]